MHPPYRRGSARSELGHSGSGGQHHPRPSRKPAHLVEKRLDFVFTRIADAYGVTRRHGAFELEDIDPELGIGERADAFQHKFSFLVRHLDVLGRLVRFSGQRIHEQFEEERYVIAGACVPDPRCEVLLGLIDGLAGIRSIPGRALSPHRRLPA